MPVDEQTSRNNWVTITGRTGKIEKLKEVLAQGADINHFDGAATALMYAAERGHFEYVKEILALGADPTRTNKEGKTALDFATIAKQKKIVKYLLDYRPSEALHPETKEHLAATQVPVQEAQELLSAIRDGLDVNSVDDHGATRLLRASATKKDHLVEILLAHHADPHVATRFGHTPTMLAVYHGNTEITRRLFKAGGYLPEAPLFLPSTELLKNSGLDKLITKHNATGFKALWKKRIRIAETSLTVTDFERFPVWECCGDEDDQTGVQRPVPFVEPFDHPVMGLVRVDFTLAGGGSFSGYANWDGFSGIPFVQTARPTLWAGSEWIDFYDTFKPPAREQMDHVYELLGCPADHVFPIRVRSFVELAGQPREGVIEGFHWYDCGKGGSQKILVVR
jgi:hypothetical protein